MAQTFRERFIWEIALLVRSYHDTVNERAKAGDIVAIRKPFGHEEVGTGERSLFLWLRIRAHMQLGDLDLSGVLEENDIRYEKRRYCIPFARLSKVAPLLDISRVEDPLDPYQPFMGGLDLDQEYDVMTFDEATLLLISEGKTLIQIAALLDPIRDEVLTKRLGRRNPLDDRKLSTRVIYRRHSDGSFALNLGGEQTGGHFLAPRNPLQAKGLVFDKATRRYL